jgi:glycerophosphoryl diester phosphodiesterase
MRLPGLDSRRVLAIEVDLRATADGEIVIMHDETVDRTTNGSGEVGEMTFAEIRSLDAGGHVPARVPHPRSSCRTHATRCRVIRRRPYRRTISGRPRLI